MLTPENPAQEIADTPDTQRLGRKTPRIEKLSGMKYTPIRTSMHAIYTAVTDTAELYNLHSVPYDAQATAYARTADDQPRTEPLMVSSWLGLNESDPNNMIIDMAGLRIILRGIGDIQEAVHGFMEDLGIEPDQGTTGGEVTTYTMGSLIEQLK